MLIERKKHPCVQCLKDKYIFSKGRCKECDAKVKSAVKQTKKKEKKESIPELKKKLDTVFSQFIRLRNADHNGQVECYTSGKILHWTRAQAGHFISRRHLGTRWNEINVQNQSVDENIFNQGNAAEFGRRIIKDYGIEEYEKLFVLKTMNSSQFKDRFFYEQMIIHYTEKVKELKKRFEGTPHL